MKIDYDDKQKIIANFMSWLENDTGYFSKCTGQEAAKAAHLFTLFFLQYNIKDSVDEQ